MLSDAYLAKINRQGRVVWEREFGGRNERNIQSLAPVPSSDDVVVTGKYNDQTWLARIAADGHIVWERFVGSGKGASVTIAGDKIAVAAIEAFQDDRPGAAQAYRDDVGLWRFDAAGTLLDHHVVRGGMNSVRGVYGANLQTESSEDALYVFSGWSAFNTDKPLEVTKINSLGNRDWRKELSSTVVQQGDKLRTSCPLPAMTVLPGGDALIACSHVNKIQLLQLRSQTGELVERWVQQPSPPPACGNRWPRVSYLKPMSEGALWLFGSTFNCAWLGKISLERLSQEN
jgi:hypothetical protein